MRHEPRISRGVNMQQQFTILAVETSCDETAAAVLAFERTAANSNHREARYKLLSNVVSSQVKLHAKFGGVVPMLAAREQQKNIEPVITEALRDAKCKLGDIDYFAVTRGPGLIPSLHVGVNYARAIAFSMQRPLLGINHIEGHIYSNWLEPITESTKHKLHKTQTNSQFPILNLVVSGGHTELILMRGHGKYEIVGETLDDAAGEAFDKVARMLGLAYPGGPALAKTAEKGNPVTFAFPRPMLASKNFNFSFSGLKTAVLYKLQELGYDPPLAKGRSGGVNLPKPPPGRLYTHWKHRSRPRNPPLENFSLRKEGVKADICASFEQAVVDALTAKTIRAAKTYGAKGVFLAGGVSANKKLRKTFTERIGKELPGIAYRHPDLAYTGDNAAMIAMAAYFRVTHDKRLTPRPRSGRATNDKKWPEVTRAPRSFSEVVADANLRIA